MRIQVRGDDTIDQQARTYAEYRVFAALTQLARAEQVRDVRIALRRNNRHGAGDSVACLITVLVAGSKPIRVLARGEHPYAAINRAVESLRGATPTGRIDGGGVEIG